MEMTKSKYKWWTDPSKVPEAAQLQQPAGMNLTIVMPMAEKMQKPKSNPKPVTTDKLPFGSQPSLAAVGQKQGGYTGSGPDGVVQPDRPAQTDLLVRHEGEYVLTAKEVNMLGGPQAVRSIIDNNLVQKGHPEKVDVYSQEDGGFVEPMGSGDIYVQKTGGYVPTTNPDPQGGNNYSPTGNIPYNRSALLNPPNPQWGSGNQAVQPLTLQPSTQIPANPVSQQTPTQPSAQAVQPIAQQPNDVNTIQSAARGMMTGQAYAPTATANLEATSELNRQKAAQTAQQVSVAGLTGQGAGQQAMQAAEQQGATSTSQMMLANAQAQEAMKERGAAALQSADQYASTALQDRMAMIDTFQSRGIDVNEAINTMISNGTATEADRPALISEYQGYAKTTDPVLRLTNMANDPNLFTDEQVSRMFPDAANVTAARADLKAYFIDPTGTLSGVSPAAPDTSLRRGTAAYNQALQNTPVLNIMPKDIGAGIIGFGGTLPDVGQKFQMGGNIYERQANEAHEKIGNQEIIRAIDYSTTPPTMVTIGPGGDIIQSSPAGVTGSQTGTSF